MFKGYERFWSFEHILLILLAVGGLIVYIFLYDTVFPSGAIDFRYSRGEVVKIGEEFLEKNDIDLEGYKQSTIFGADDNASVYLSKNLEVSGLNKLVNTGKVPVWRWELRWFKPGEKREYRLHITPEGEVVGFSMLLPEDEKGENLSGEEAKDIALKEFKMLHPTDIEKWELLEESSEKLPNRTDHHFVWENKEVTYGEKGKMRVSVDIAGNKISRFKWYLKVPEHFIREYSNQKSYGRLLGYLSTFFMILLFVGAVIIFLRSFRKRQLSKKFALIIGLIIVGAVLLMRVNFFPTDLMGYDTSSAYSSFLTSNIITGIISALIFGTVMAVIAGSGDVLGHRYFKRTLLSIDSIRDNIWSKNLSFSALRGVCLIFIFIGLQTLFYLISTKYLGVWSPAENEYSEAYGTFLPFLTPIAISIIAGVAEEFSFRLFGISLIKKLTGSTFLGALIASAVWALGHSTYSIFPVYTRGIELTLFGLILSLFFLRYGLLAVIIAHFGIDTIYIGFPLLKAGNTTFFIYGVIVMVIAVIPLGLLFLVRRKEYRGFFYKEPNLSTDILLDILRDPFKTDTHIPEVETSPMRLNSIISYLNYDFGGDRDDISIVCGRFVSMVKELLQGRTKEIQISEDRAVFEVRGVGEEVLKLITGIRVGVYQVNYKPSDEKDLVLIEKFLDR